MTVEINLQLHDFTEDENLLIFLNELHAEYRHNEVVASGSFTSCKHTVENAVRKNAIVREFALNLLGMETLKNLTMQQASALEYFLKNIDSLTEDKLKTL